jgi:glutathione S-transferase
MVDPDTRRRAEVAPEPPPVVLRYFDARGRAQHVRNYFACREIAYADERVALSPGFEAWQAIRGDRAVAGPFHKLPVLHWGDQIVAETSVIYAFLHRSTGDEALLSEGENLRHAMLFSSLYMDVMMPIGILIWADLMFRGLDVAAYAKAALARIRGHFGTLDHTLEEWQWGRNAEKRPVMLVDCTLWEEIDIVRHVFGEHLRLHEFATLSRIYHEAPGRAVFERLIATHPASVTGRGLASEGETLAKIRELIAA